MHAGEPALLQRYHGVRDRVGRARKRRSEGKEHVAQQQHVEGVGGRHQDARGDKQALPEPEQMLEQVEAKLTEAYETNLITETRLS